MKVRFHDNQYPVRDFDIFTFFITTQNKRNSVIFTSHHLHVNEIEELIIPKLENLKFQKISREPPISTNKFEIIFWTYEITEEFGLWLKLSENDSHFVEYDL